MQNKSLEVTQLYAALAGLVLMVLFGAFQNYLSGAIFFIAAILITEVIVCGTSYYKISNDIGYSTMVAVFCAVPIIAAIVLIYLIKQYNKANKKIKL